MTSRTHRQCLIVPDFADCQGFIFVALHTSLLLKWPGLGPHCHGFVSICTCVFQRCVDWPGLGPHCRGFIFVALYTVSYR